MNLIEEWFNEFGEFQLGRLMVHIECGNTVTHISYRFWNS